MKLKFLLHYVPITLLHQKTGLSNLIDRKWFTWIYMDVQWNLLHGTWVTNGALCCSKGHPWKRSWISFAPVIQMFPEVSVDSCLGCASHLPTIVQGSCCLSHALCLICQCILVQWFTWLLKEYVLVTLSRTGKLSTRKYLWKNWA